jgi:hypothetical protein
MPLTILLVCSFSLSLLSISLQMMFMNIFCKIKTNSFWLPIKLLVITAFIFSACQQANMQNAQENKKALAAIAHAKSLLKDGALVTRSDDDFESLTLQNFSTRERAYSHSGIAFKEDSGYVVYHCMAGIENPDGAMRRDPFDSFVNPLKKTGFGIFQYQLSDSETTHFHQLIQKEYFSKIPFDNSFDLMTDDSLYCSEMIYKNLKAASNGRVILPTSVIHNFKPKIIGYKFNKPFYATFEYIGMDDLYLNSFCKEITRVKY